MSMGVECKLEMMIESKRKKKMERKEIVND